jgi:hypothetical protein
LTHRDSDGGAILRGQRARGVVPMNERPGRAVHAIAAQERGALSSRAEQFFSRGAPR